MKPISERLEDVGLGDLVGAFEVRSGSGHAPRPVEPASRQASLLSPALQSSSRNSIQACQLAQPRRLQLGVEAALPFQLNASRANHAFADGCGRFTTRLGGECFEGYPLDPDLQVDPIEQRT